MLVVQHSLAFNFILSFSLWTKSYNASVGHYYWIPARKFFSNWMSTSEQRRTYLIHLCYFQGLYSDLSSFHLINQASVDDLNDRISGTKISPYNFRPTILIEGPNATAFAEDGWDWIKIGDVVMRNVKPCTRCIMTTIDPNTAVRSPLREPLKTLET